MTELHCLTFIHKDQELIYLAINWFLLQQVKDKSCVFAEVWFTKDPCLLSHGRLWMRRWRMDAGHEDWRHKGTWVSYASPHVCDMDINFLISVFRKLHYDSHFWGDRNPYNMAGGKTGFDSQETKLPTYWNTAFSKICLGMKIGYKLRFLTINKSARSLYSLIADGQYRATSLGRNTWKKLIGSQASLQTNCNKESAALNYIPRPELVSQTMKRMIVSIVTPESVLIWYWRIPLWHKHVWKWG